MDTIYRNVMTLTSVVKKNGRLFAFGLLHEEEPRSIFLPPWVVKAYALKEGDQGVDFDCLFVVRENDVRPCVIGLVDEQMTLKKSEEVGFYSGVPGQSDFEAKLNQLNVKESA